MATIEGVQRRLLLLGIGTAVAMCLAGWTRAGGVLLGVGITSLSLWLYAQIFEAAVRTGRRRLAIALTFVKLAAFLALGWGAMRWGARFVDPMGFAIGVTCLPIATLWEALRAGGN